MENYLEFQKFKHDYFKERFNALRVAHQLNGKTLATLLGLKSGASILSMENGKLKPSIDVLLSIASLFGVSIDWLYGRSDEIYSEKELTVLENLMCEFVIAERKIEFREFDDLTKRYCNDLEYRRKEFSLAERANIVFLLQYLKVVLERDSTLIIKDEDKSAFWSVEAIKKIVAGRTKRMRFADAISERNYIMKSIYFILMHDWRYEYKEAVKIDNEPLFFVEKLLIIESRR